MRQKPQENVYVAYLRAGLRDIAFPQKGRSFKAARQGVLHQAHLFSCDNHGVLVHFFLRKGALTFAANNDNINAFFGQAQKDDVHVCDVVPVSKNVSTVREVPRRKSAPKKLVEKKNFVGFCVIDDKQHVFPVTATGYMKARDWVVKYAEALTNDLSGKQGVFCLRNQLIEEGQKVEDLILVPWKDEPLVCFEPDDDGVKFVFPGTFNKKFKPNQSVHDRDVFEHQGFQRLAREIQEEIALLPPERVKAPGISRPRLRSRNRGPLRKK